jgi:tetratricopeptide (TPR) repeat protein
MMRSLGILVSALLWVTLTAAPVHADGPGAFRPQPRPPAAPVISELQAIETYNLGYAAIQRADHAQALAEAESDPQEKKQSQSAARKAFEESLQHFQEAVRLDASMHEAFTYLGYANRKLGRHSEALEAYGRALSINPDYPHAIEYQGQAFLGLNRIDDARFNYLRLYALNKGQAGKLLQAMQSWVADHNGTQLKDVDVNAFAEWVARRVELTRNDPISTGW